MSDTPTWVHNNPAHCWYFAPRDNNLPYGDGRPIQKGVVHTVPRVALPSCGLYASRYILGCLVGGCGCQIWRVELSGEVHEDLTEMAATKRRYLWGLDGTDLLLAFGRRCTLEALGSLDSSVSFRPDFFTDNQVFTYNDGSIMPITPHLRLMPKADMPPLEECAWATEACIQAFLRAYQYREGLGKAVIRWIACCADSLCYANGITNGNFTAGYWSRFSQLNAELESLVWQEAEKHGWTRELEIWERIPPMPSDEMEEISVQ